jgi:iron complex transport system permease protein
MRRNLAILPVLFALLLLLIVVATGLGYIRIPAMQVLQILASRLVESQVNGELADKLSVVVYDIRLPRILAAALVGGGLAVAGGVFQSLLLNPLADPYTLGVSSGAAFGASLAILLTLFGIQLPTAWTVPVFAFIGAILTLMAVFSLSSKDPRMSSNTLILAGVIVAAILSAGIGFIKYMADEEVGIIIFWLMGSLVGKSWPEVQMIFFITLPCLLVILYYARDLNIIALGTKTADSLGVETLLVRKILLVAATLITASCVSISGIIGFIGLIIPHLLRMLLGADNRLLLPASFLAGAILLLGADTLTRALLPHEIPIGVLTALIGGPFFCYIFRRRQLGRTL